MRKYLYVNKRNANKRLEVHYDGYGHYTVKQFIQNPITLHRNYTGDRCFHRWRKANLVELLKDYQLTI